MPSPSRDCCKPRTRVVQVACKEEIRYNDPIKIYYYLRAAVIKCDPTKLLPEIISPVCSSGLAQNTRPEHKLC